MRGLPDCQVMALTGDVGTGTISLSLLSCPRGHAVSQLQQTPSVSALAAPWMGLMWCPTLPVTEHREGRGSAYPQGHAVSVQYVLLVIKLLEQVDSKALMLAVDS